MIVKIFFNRTLTTQKMLDVGFLMLDEGLGKS